jgi:3-carboxy-cis,cis-muconate cycloisomerase
VWRRSAGNPVVPLVRALTAAAGDPAAAHVHRGATSQDVLDTALVLVARRALVPVLADLHAAADSAAGLARAHRATPMAGRTLLQQAVPTTFGAVAAGWLVGLDQVRDRLAAVRDGLPAQLGGAAGTLATLDGRGLEVLAAYAADLGLAVPAVPWHTLRVPVADLAGALGTAAGLCGKVATDLVLLAQTEVGEVTAGSGGSSAMPHKRNPVGPVLVRAAARRAPGLVATLFAAMDHELQRAAGGWQAEWEPLRDLLGITGAAAHHLRATLEALTVDPGRMRANLDAGGGVLLAEQVAAGLAPALGRSAAHDLVARVAAAAADQGRPFADLLAATPEVTAALTPGELAATLDPTAALGSAGAIVDRALAAHDRAAATRGTG